MIKLSDMYRYAVQNGFRFFTSFEEKRATLEALINVTLSTNHVPPSLYSLDQKILGRLYRRLLYSFGRYEV